MNLAAESVYQTPFVNSTLLPMLLLSLTKQRHTPKTATKIYDEYDYVIVGGGSSGSVLAARLTELQCVSVLLLEAGKSPPISTEVPATARSFWFTDIDWAYRTAPQRYTGEALVNRQVVWPSGKMLGGSSVLNGMKAVRGNRKNYDDWAAEGAEGWSYKDVLPYFIKMEDNRDQEYVSNGYHGVGGPQTIEKPRYKGEIKGPLIDAAKQMGYRFVDSNGPSQKGFYDFQATTRFGQRCSTAKAYLVPAENRTNLDILTNAFVSKVVIKNRRATGVKFEFDGYTYEVNAKREVIMSAGTVNTAQLLMLSGIGPKEELKNFKIPVIADLPVGKNLQEHCGVPTFFTLSRNIQPSEQKLKNPRNIKQYISKRTGPLASSTFVSIFAFINGLRNKTKSEIPDQEVYFREEEITDAVREAFGLKPEVFERVFGPYRGQPLYACESQLLHPKSRGTVTLKSANPRVPPVIDPNYFEDHRDMRDVVEGMKFCMKVGRSTPMRRIGSKPLSTLFPACARYYGDEDSYLWCVARQYVVTFSHQVGTAKMGDPNDPTVVVDPQLRVKNIKGLRVIDASVMPLIPYGNTNLPTIMIAEKASDMIKRTIQCDYDYPQEEWKEPESSSAPINIWNSETDDSPQEKRKQHKPSSDGMSWNSNSDDYLQEKWKQPESSSGSVNSWNSKTDNYPQEKREKHIPYKVPINRLNLNSDDYPQEKRTQYRPYTVPIETDDYPQENWGQHKSSGRSINSRNSNSDDYPQENQKQHRPYNAPINSWNSETDNYPQEKGEQPKSSGTSINSWNSNSDEYPQEKRKQHRPHNVPINSWNSETDDYPQEKWEQPKSSSGSISWNSNSNDYPQEKRKWHGPYNMPVNSMNLETGNYPQEKLEKPKSSRVPNNIRSLDSGNYPHGKRKHHKSSSVPIHSWNSKSDDYHQEKQKQSISSSLPINSWSSDSADYPREEWDQSESSHGPTESWRSDASYLPLKSVPERKEPYFNKNDKNWKDIHSPNQRPRYYN